MQNTVEICTTAALLHFLINVKRIELEKVICKTLGLFFNTLTAYDKYSVLNMVILMKPIEMQLFKKEKIFYHFLYLFCLFFFAFLKSRSNFEHLGKNMIVIGYVFPILKTAKYVATHTSKQSCVRRPLYKRHGKRSQTLLKLARKNLYHIYWSVWRKLRLKKSLLVLCKIFWMFVNTLTTHWRLLLIRIF